MGLDVNWDEIKVAYIKSGLSYRKIAAKYGISFSTVQQKGVSEGWTKQKKEYKSRLIEKTVQKMIEKESEKQANRLQKIQVSADKMADVIERVFDDTKQFYRHLVTTMKDGEMSVECRTEAKVDTKAIRDLTSSLKDLAIVLRNVYDIPTAQERAAMEIATERLKLDQAKANTGMGDDAEYGVVEIAPVLEDTQQDDGQEGDNND